MKKFLSVFFALMLLSSLCVPASAASHEALDDEAIAQLSNAVSNSVGTLKTDDVEINLLPSKTAVRTLSNENKYCVSATYNLELNSSIGSGSASQPDVDFVSGATVTVYIYFDRMVEDDITFVKLTRVAVSVEWSDDQIILKNVFVQYDCNGLKPADESGLGTSQYGEHSFPISGHYYSHDTGFTDFAAVGLLGWRCACTTTTTFARGAASQWEFSVTCSY